MPKVRMFGCSYGVTAVVDSVYHKLNASIEIEMEEGDDFKTVKEKAWNTVFTEIEKQVAEITGPR